MDDPVLIPFHWVPSGHQLSHIMTKQMKAKSWWKTVVRDFFWLFLASFLQTC